MLRPIILSMSIRHFYGLFFLMNLWAGWIPLLNTESKLYKKAFGCSLHNLHKNRSSNLLLKFQSVQWQMETFAQVCNRIRWCILPLWSGKTFKEPCTLPLHTSNRCTNSIFTHKLPQLVSLEQNKFCKTNSKLCMLQVYHLSKCNTGIMLLY